MKVPVTRARFRALVKRSQLIELDHSVAFDRWLYFDDCVADEEKELQLRLVMPDDSES